MASTTDAVVDHHHPLTTQPAATLLGALQADIRADRRPPGAPLLGEADGRLELLSEDDSVRIHACHGRARQVEVMREAILHRLADDPTLEPRDVIVMCPEVEEFAPLIQATFGTATEATDGELRVRLADRSLRQTNPLLAVVARLLELAGARLTASAVLDLIDSAPVRQRFGISDDDLAELRGWVSEAAIHWGIDAADRAPYRLDSLDAGTWESGLRRLLLSVAVAGDGAASYGGVAPAGSPDSGTIELVGRFAELLARLGAARRELAGPQTVAQWTAAVWSAADMLTATGPRDAWQRTELSRLLDDIAAEAGARAGTVLSQAEARALIGERLRGRPTRANFRTGHLTVCTLVPMRSVPHRLVCLLGLDDQAFPRRTPRDGDDLLLDDPHVGDRDPRAEDRQLLLDALLAAEQGLVITYSGNDERTNAPRPPAVPVGELLDAIDATARTPDGETRARERVLVRHPLQPFDPRNFARGRLTGDADLPQAAPWSFDQVALAGARELIDPARRTTEIRFLDGPLPPRATETIVALADLIAFAERPVRAFLRQRLGILVGSWDDEISDDLPVAVTGLERYGVGQRLLDALLAGVEPLQAINAEIARGKLPPGELGRPVVRQVWRDAAKIAAHARLHGGSGEPRSLETNVTLSGGVRLSGTVSGLHDHVLLTVGFSRLNPRHRIAAWVRLLALSAAHPEVPWETVTIGRSGARGSTVALARLRQLAGDPGTRRTIAVAELDRLVALREEGLAAPLPLPSLTAAAYAAAELSGADTEKAALAEWRSTYNFDREDRDPENVRVFDGELPLAGLAGYASQLWRPLLTRETVEHE